MSKIKHLDKAYVARAKEARSNIVVPQKAVAVKSEEKIEDRKEEAKMACQKPGLKMKKPAKGRKPKAK